MNVLLSFRHLGLLLLDQVTMPDNEDPAPDVRSCQIISVLSGISTISQQVV